MGIIRNALIGIALYEAVAYVLKKKSEGFSEVGSRSQDPGLNSFASSYDLASGTDPDIPLTGNAALDSQKDSWSNSLANDELRAPDS
ncbi:MAG: hypothetical protein WKF66_15880 [Pedobacter sp.]